MAWSRLQFCSLLVRRSNKRRTLRREEPERPAQELEVSREAERLPARRDRLRRVAEAGHPLAQPAAAEHRAAERLEVAELPPTAVRVGVLPEPEGRSQARVPAVVVLAMVVRAARRRVAVQRE
jgi:hypothetical protein